MAATDLSTLDATAPAAGDGVSAGDDAIRETRAAILGSFGGTDAGTGTVATEHYNKGFHKFPNGAQAARPSAGNLGRIFLNTTDKRLEVDNGSAWAMLNAVPFASTLTTAAVSITTTYASVASLTLDIPSGARLIVVAQFANTTASSPAVSGQFTVNGTAILADEFTLNAGFLASSAATQTWVGYHATPTTGAAVPVALQLKHVSSGAAITVYNRRLFVLLV